MIDSKYLLERVDAIKRAIDIHKITLERRFRMDEVIEDNLMTIEVELTLLRKSIEKKEK